MQNSFISLSIMPAAKQSDSSLQSISALIIGVISASNGLYTNIRRKKISPKNKKDLGMACHTPPLKKAKKQGEMPLPSLDPIPLKNVEFRDGMGYKTSNIHPATG